MLLDVWKSFEETHGTEADVAKVESMKPIVSKKRHLDEETGEQVEGLCFFALLLETPFRLRSLCDCCRLGLCLC